MPARIPLALEVRDLRKTYGAVQAVNGLELSVGTGECFGLLGPNGAGKTTTIEICEGLLEPDSGDVIVLGRRWTSDERELRQRLGIQLQETQFAEKITVEETVTLFRSFYRQGPAVGEIVRLVQLEALGKRRPSDGSNNQIVGAGYRQDDANHDQTDRRADHKDGKRLQQCQKLLHARAPGFFTKPGE